MLKLFEVMENSRACFWYGIRIVWGGLLLPAMAFAGGGAGELYRDPLWRAFLHCRSHSSETCDSAVSDGSYFIHPSGADDPRSELEATVRLMSSSDERLSGEYRCKYPARYEWLRNYRPELRDGFELSQCAELHEWYQAIDPHSLTLIFPSSYLNNPASAFGHTLLRIDQPNQNEETRLIAYTANFAANTLGEGPLQYAFKGIFGGYAGFFSVAPYYDKVRKYSDMENRDIWEYQLTYTPEEARRIVLHVWELRNIAFGYYYFDDNCSFQLLRLLNVGRPSLELTEDFSTWVMPIDTIRSILLRDGLFTRAIFRPALATKLRDGIDRTDPELYSAVLSLADPSIPLEQAFPENLTDGDRARILDLAYDYILYSRIRAREEDSEGESRAWKLLALRSKVSRSIPAADLPEPEFRPEMGHDTAKVGVGFGRRGGKWMSEFRFLPAFHEQLDDPRGYLVGSQMKFLDTRVRLLEDEGVEFQGLQLIDIESFSPRDEFFGPKSWTARMGAQRQNNGNGEEPFVFSVAGGLGGAYRLAANSFVYGLVEGELEASRSLRPDVGFGVGPRAGVVSHAFEGGSFQLDVRLQRFEVGEERTKMVGELSHRVTLGKDLALRLTLERSREIGPWETTMMMELQYFFFPS